jgi:uncharacterized protein YegL
MLMRVLGCSFFTALLFLVACNKPDFSAESGRGASRPPQSSPTPTPGGTINQGRDNSQNGTGNNNSSGNEGLGSGDQNAQGYALTCRDPQPRRETLNANAGTNVVVKGELCPTSFGKLTILFVVDFSGSMEENDPRTLLPLLSCGRLEAARAIVRKIEADISDKDDVRIGLVSFGNSARIAENIISLKDFKSNLNTFELCGHDQQATNYRQAFEQSRVALNGIDGNKVVYFISDGLPTMGADNAPPDNNDAGGHHKQAGLQAMQALQQNTQNLTVNAVFLNRGQTGQAEFNYLTQLTGAASRVRVASDAAQLADKVVELSIPRAVLQEQQAKGTVEAPGAGIKPVALTRFFKDTTREGVWLFETAPIPMTSAPGATTANTIVVSAPDRNNTNYSTSIVVNFRPN